MKSGNLKFIPYIIVIISTLFVISIIWGNWIWADDQVPNEHYFNEELTKQLKILGYYYIYEHTNGSFDLRLDEYKALYKGEFTWRVYSKINNPNKSIYFSYWQNPTNDEKTFFWHNEGEFNVKDGIVQEVSIMGGVPRSDIWNHNHSLTQMYHNNVSFSNGSVGYIYKGSSDSGNLSRFYVAYFEGNIECGTSVHISKFGLADGKEFLVMFDV